MGNYFPLLTSSLHGTSQRFSFQLQENLRFGKTVGNVSYEIGATHYKREYFCSFPDQVMMIRYTSNGNPMTLG